MKAKQRYCLECGIKLTRTDSDGICCSCDEMLNDDGYIPGSGDYYGEDDYISDYDDNDDAGYF